MNIAAIAVLTLVMAAAPLTAKKKKSPDQALPAIPDQTVAVRDGTILFQNLRIEQCNEFGILSEPHLLGTVVNNTLHTWRALRMRLNAITSDGTSRLMDLVYLNDFKPSDRARLGGKCGLSLTLLPKNLASWGFLYDSGFIETFYDLTLSKPVSNDSLQFSDELIAIAFKLTRTSIAFALFNKGSSAIQIDWNKAAFVDCSGRSHSVIHEGVKFGDASSSKPPTVIPPGARSEDEILPADNVHMGSKDWITDNLLPLAPEAELLQGHEFAIYFPLESAGKSVEYNFSFHIRNVRY